jgi:predicted Zn finger-like uncharacterized protein
MSTSHKTQCPHCKGLFQVTDQQLEIANGTVRCGSCLGIFQAEDHFLDPKSSASPFAPGTLYESTDINHEEEVDESWALELLKELEEESNINKKPFSDAENPETGQPNTPTLEKAPDLPVLQSNPTNKAKKIEPLSETFRNLDASKNTGHDHFGAFADNSVPVENKDIDEDNWTKELLKQSRDDSPIEAAPSDGQDSISDIKSASQYDSTPTKTPSSTTTNAFGIGDELTAFRENQKKSSSATNIKDFMSTIEIEPVTLDLNHGGTRKFLHALTSIVLVLILAMALGVQYLTYNMSTLAKNPQLRPFYSKACELLGCTLPLQSDLAAIRGKNLLVRSHPSKPGALMIDLIITNYASFPQQFPLLELTFSDANSFPVARRRFKPDEYLSGGLLKLGHMPERTPLHISMAILDPGKDAVNYYVVFHENTPSL